MTGRSTPIPNIHLQPPSVDFIDNRLQDYHEAFKNRQAQYDAALRRYAPAPPAASMPTSPPPTKPAGEQLPQPRKLLPAVAAMVFWTFIFADSVKKFAEDHPDEPKYRYEDGYSIRGKESWEDIYSELQRARESYDGTKKGFWGRVKRGFRRVADNSDPIKQLVKIIPENEYVSPVLAVLEVLVDVS
jgi:hypothetical protein